MRRRILSTSDNLRTVLAELRAKQRRTGAFNVDALPHSEVAEKQRRDAARWGDLVAASVLGSHRRAS